MNQVLDEIEEQQAAASARAAAVAAAVADSFAAASSLLRVCNSWFRSSTSFWCASHSVREIEMDAVAAMMLDYLGTRGKKENEVVSCNSSFTALRLRYHAKYLSTFCTQRA